MSQQQVKKTNCFTCGQEVYTVWERDENNKPKFFNDEAMQKPHKHDRKPYSGSSPFTDAEDIAYVPIKEVNRIQNLLQHGYKLFGKSALDSHLQGLDTANSAIAVLVKPKYNASQASGQPASKGAAVTN